MCAATGEPALDRTADCLAWHEKRIGTRADDAERYGVPLIISEFGACLGTESCVQEIKSVADTCDDNLVGWAYWQFKNYADLTTSAGTHSEGFYENDSTLQHAKVKALARTYLPATQGTPLTLNFDTTSSNFIATFTVNTSITLPTVVYANTEYYYPNGHSIVVTDN